MMMFWSIFFDTTAAYRRVVTSVMPRAAIPTRMVICRMLLPPNGTGHSQGEREAAPDHGMPNHGSVSAMPPAEWSRQYRMLGLTSPQAA